MQMDKPPGGWLSAPTECTDTTEDHLRSARLEHMQHYHPNVAGANNASMHLTVDPLAVDDSLAEPADGGWHRGDWMQTYTGLRFYPLSPRAEDVEPADIAHALSLLCRYNGHIRDFYSVAEHCVLMSDYLLRRAGEYAALEALLHDGTEAFIGDMIRPLKHTPEMTPYRTAEDRVEDAIAVRFGLDLDANGHHHKRADVQDADTRILLTERTALMPNYKPSDRWSMDGMEPLPVPIHAWAPPRAELEYTKRLDALWTEL